MAFYYRCPKCGRPAEGKWVDSHNHLEATDEDETICLLIICKFCGESISSPMENRRRTIRWDMLLEAEDIWDSDYPGG